MSTLSNSRPIEKVSLDLLRDYDRGLRVHPRHQRQKITKLLKRYGQVWPILVAPDYTIIDGHALRDGLREAGFAQADVLVVADQSPAEINALRLAINRLPSDSRWDHDSLRADFVELLELGFDLDLTGFDAAEIDFTLNLDMPSANAADDFAKIPQRQEKAVSQRGDIFQLGRHRIGCGDARDYDFLHLVRMGRPAQVVFIDPPFNVPISGFVSGKGRHRHRNFVEGAGEMSEQVFFDLLCGSLDVLRNSCEPSALIFGCMDGRHILELTAAGKLLNLPLLNICVWTKTNAGMGGLYRNQHELIAVFKAGTLPHQNNVELGRFGRNRSNVWTHAGMSAFGAGRDNLLALHPTVKPVPLIADALRDTTGRGDVVLDTFSGSGSTLIAAEEIGRTCFAVELDPLYVDVSIRRWQATTGHDAVHVASGRRFDDMTPRLLRDDGDGRVAR
ncbi:MAG: DNA methyltransferase [Afipia sp.]|nr:DNA methyltransferase [Afipia sp.]